MPKGKELKALVSISGQVDKSLGKSIQSASSSLKGLGKAAKTISKVSAVAIGAVATGAAAAGKALLDLGTQFDSANDTIRIGTGATGKDLAALQNDMKEVYATVPTTLDDAGSAIADYNTRLGLTGKNLQGLSEQAIQVSSMLGEDLSSTIEESSQAFQQWGIKADDMGKQMDYIFKVSQSTGMGFNELMGNMQSYGAQLQSMGYSFEDAASLMGQLDKAGVNTSEVLGAMKKSVTTMAKDGKSATKGLQEYFDAIKNAKTETEATAKASEVFGARAASTMSAAIRNGTLNVKDLTKSLEDSKESISGAAGDTYDFAEKLQLFKQNVQLAFEPLASTVFDSINDAMPYIQDAVDDLQPKIADFAKNLGPKISDFIETTLPELSQFAGQAVTEVGNLIAWVTDNWDTISKVGPVVAGVALALGPVATGVGNIGKIVKTVGGGIGGFAGKLSGAADAAEKAAPAVSSAGASFQTMAGQALLLVAAGAAVMMIAVAMKVLVGAAIQLAQAGPAAVGVFVLLAGVSIGVTAAIVAIGSAATVSAVGLLAMGAAVLMVGSGIAIAAAGAALFCTQLPTIAAYGPVAAAGIMALSVALLTFSGTMIAMSASLIAGVASLTAFGASAIVASAGAAAFGLSMAGAAASCGILLAALLGIQASVSTINSNATSAASSLSGMATSVNAVQSVLGGLGDKAKSAVSSFLSIFQNSAPQAQADGTALGTSLANGIATGMTAANAAFITGFTMLKATAAVQLSALKTMFANTKLQLNHDIDLPHFSLSGALDASKNKVPTTSVKWYAQGGFTDGISIAGEAGTEAVLSFDPAYRSQNLSYWAKAGQMLGVNSDFIDLFSGQTSGGNTTEINLGQVSFAPNITINGNASKDDIVAALKQEEPEFFDLLDEFIAKKQEESYAYNF